MERRKQQAVGKYSIRTSRKNTKDNNFFRNITWKENMKYEHFFVLNDCKLSGQLWPPYKHIFQVLLRRELFWILCKRFAGRTFSLFAYTLLGKEWI
jgi:hypothetical protein